MDLLHTMLESQGHRDVVRMPAGQVPDIRAVVVDLGRLAGARPSTRQPLPGMRKVNWECSHLTLKATGGEYRNRTGVHGFAIRCVTTPPTRQRVRLT